MRLTAFCAPALSRGAGGAQATTGACEQWTPCTTVTGPWVTSPKYGDDTYLISCTGTARAVGSDANFPGAIAPVGIEIGGGLRPGDVRGFYFGVLPTPNSITYQPVVGCSPGGARVIAGPSQVSTRRIVRTRRVRPGEPVRLRLECPRGRRLVHSGSGLAFFTDRPPSRRVVRALRHRHRRGKLASRTFVALPPGVGDDERVELQVSALCSARR